MDLEVVPPHRPHRLDLSVVGDSPRAEPAEPGVACGRSNGSCLPPLPETGLIEWPALRLDIVLREDHPPRPLLDSQALRRGRPPATHPGSADISLTSRPRLAGCGRAA